MARDLDREDRKRALTGEMATVEALRASNEFRYFLQLVDVKIEHWRTALEKDADAAETAMIRGRIAALRSVPKILNDHHTTLANELRTNQGA